MVRRESREDGGHGIRELLYQRDEAVGDEVGHLDVVVLGVPVNLYRLPDERLAERVEAFGDELEALERRLVDAVLSDAGEELVGEV